MNKKSPELPPIYFDLKSNNYLMELNPGRFTPLSSSDVKAHLQMRGHHTDMKNDHGLSFGNEILAKAQVHSYVDYAGPLAGYKAGMMETRRGERLLVTKSVNVPEPGKKKSIPWFEDFVSQIFTTAEQMAFFFAWLKIGYEALYDGTMMPGQLLGLIGPGGCGKTFMQWCITGVLGGRYARPYQYMVGKTPFNEDLAMAEHHIMGDEEMSYDIRARKKFGAMIKQLCVEPAMRVHGKGKLAFTAETFRRLTASVNDEPEHMLFFPPFDSDIKPKIMLLKCSPAKVLDRNRDKNQKRFFDELPAIAAYLRGFNICRAMQDDRFGVKAYQHPELIATVEESAPEIQLLKIIDDDLKLDDQAAWFGTAEDLKLELQSGKHASTVYELLKFPNAAGWYLSRLKQKFPARFVKTSSKGRTRWTITKEETNG